MTARITVLEEQAPRRERLHKFLETTRKRFVLMKDGLQGEVGGSRIQLKALREGYLLRGVLEGGDLEKLLAPDKSAWEALVGELRRLGAAPP